ncbi:MAG: hypothetical protein ACOY5R_17285 [Pseudomonadota bacterium]
MQSRRLSLSHGLNGRIGRLFGFVSIGYASDLISIVSRPSRDVMAVRAGEMLWNGVDID